MHALTGVHVPCLPYKMDSASGIETTSFATAIRGHHVYKTVWTPIIGETVMAMQEHGNRADHFAVAVQRSSSTDDSLKITVGHLPREQSRVLWYFLDHGGIIRCEITGRRR